MQQFRQKRGGTDAFARSDLQLSRSERDGDGRRRDARDGGSGPAGAAHTSGSAAALPHYTAGGIGEDAIALRVADRSDMYT